MSAILKYKIWVFTFVGLLVLASAVAIAMSETDTDQKTYSWRYKITVNVETPEGIKTGSAVREVTNRDNTISGEKIPEAGARISRIKGEAVVVDLGESGVVFALIEHGSYGELYSAFGIQNASNTTEGFDRLTIGAKAPLPEENWPMFVTFADMDDPKSVALVRGWKFNPETQKQDPVRRFSEQFGDGVNVEDVTIEIVDESVTRGAVNEWLPKSFEEEITNNWRNLPYELRSRIHGLTRFKQGEEK